MKKYELTSETKVIDGVEVHRIKAIKSFGSVGKGELGGWIESEKNLSQRGDAWVCRHAIVYDNARVYDNAMISGNAVVRGNAVVEDNATVGEDATVEENAWVRGNARVGGDAVVRRNAVVSENAVVSGTIVVSENATVRETATFRGNATVRGNAEVSGYAVVGENADYIVFKNWWSSGRFFTWTRSNNKWKVGCFYGSGEELIAKAYKDSEKSGREYERVVKYVESLLKEEDNNK